MPVLFAPNRCNCIHHLRYYRICCRPCSGPLWNRVCRKVFRLVRHCYRHLSLVQSIHSTMIFAGKIGLELGETPVAVLVMVLVFTFGLFVVMLVGMWRRQPRYMLPGLFLLAVTSLFTALRLPWALTTSPVGDYFMIISSLVINCLYFYAVLSYYKELQDPEKNTSDLV